MHCVMVYPLYSVYYRRKNLVKNSLSWAVGFKSGILLLPEDGTLVPKHVGDTSLMFTCI